MMVDKQEETNFISSSNNYISISNNSDKNNFKVSISLYFMIRDEANFGIQFIERLLELNPDERQLDDINHLIELYNFDQINYENLDLQVKNKRYISNISELHQLIAINMQLLEFPEGNKVLKHKDSCKFQYVLVLSGNVKVFDWRDREEEFPLQTYNVGDIYSEKYLMRQLSRPVLFTFQSKTSLGITKYEDFQEILVKNTEGENESKLLGEIYLFQYLSLHQFGRVLQSLTIKQFSKDDYVFKAGQQPQGIYIIKSGDFQIIQDINFTQKNNELSEGTEHIDSQEDIAKFNKQIDHQRKSKNTKGMVIRVMSSNEIFGESDIIQQYCSQQKQQQSSQQQQKKFNHYNQQQKQQQQQLQQFQLELKRCYSVKCISLKGSLIFINVNDLKNKVLDTLKHNKIEKLLSKCQEKINNYNILLKNIKQSVSPYQQYLLSPQKSSKPDKDNSNKNNNDNKFFKQVKIKQPTSIGQSTTKINFQLQQQRSSSAGKTFVRADDSKKAQAKNQFSGKIIKGNTHLDNDDFIKSPLPAEISKQKSSSVHFDQQFKNVSLNSERALPSHPKNKQISPSLTFTSQEQFSDIQQIPLFFPQNDQYPSISVSQSLDPIIASALNQQFPSDSKIHLSPTLQVFSSSNQQKQYCTERKAKSFCTNFSITPSVSQPPSQQNKPMRIQSAYIRSQSQEKNISNIREASQSVENLHPSPKQEIKVKLQLKIPIKSQNEKISVRPNLNNSGMSLLNEASAGSTFGYGSILGNFTVSSRNIAMYEQQLQDKQQQQQQPEPKIQKKTRKRKNSNPCSFIQFVPLNEALNKNNQASKATYAGLNTKIIQEGGERQMKIKLLTPIFSRGYQKTFEKEMIKLNKKNIRPDYTQEYKDEYRSRTSRKHNILQQLLNQQSSQFQNAPPNAISNLQLSSNLILPKQAIQSPSPPKLSSSFFHLPLSILSSPRMKSKSQSVQNSVNQNQQKDNTQIISQLIEQSQCSPSPPNESISISPTIFHKKGFHGHQKVVILQEGNSSNNNSYILQCQHSNNFFRSASAKSININSIRSLPSPIQSSRALSMISIFNSK